VTREALESALSRGYARTLDALLAETPVPDADPGRALVFASELLGVEEFFAEDALVVLDLPLVRGRVWPGFLVPGLVADDAGEVA
jgi:hypothetical protein